MSKSGVPIFGICDVLKEINLDVLERFLILLGPSGCGKFTLLNCVSVLLYVSEGQTIGMVFQSYAFYP